MSAMTQIAALAQSTHYVTTQWVHSFVHATRGTSRLAWAVRISMNVRTTLPAALTRCAPTCQEHTTALVLWVITRRTSHALTLMNVRSHHATPWLGVGTPLAPFHATARWALQETGHGAKTWMSVLH